MSKILIAILMMLCFSPHVIATSSTGKFACDVLIKEHNFNFKQILVTKKAYEYGRDYDLSLTLAAIVWKESSAGTNKYNPNDPSAGAFQIHINNAIEYSKYEDTPENRLRVSIDLIDNFYLSARFAVINIKNWQRLHGKDNWLKIWASYNAGYETAKGKTYAEDIHKKVSIIKQCNW